jgi:hypothetical protein
MNTTDTGRIHRVLVLWLDLQQAMAKNGDFNSVPWSSNDQAVVKLWDQLTHPNNDRALEQWLFQSAEGESAAWALKALQVARERKASLPT